jgi:hypothetical protein
MLLLYKETDKLDGLYNKIKTRRSGLPAAREEEEEVAGRVASIFGAYSRTRAPQFSSRSMSPYLLANSEELTPSIRRTWATMGDSNQMFSRNRLLTRKAE